MAISYANGKRINTSDEATMEDIVRASGKHFNPSTRCVIKENGRNKVKLQPGKKYHIKNNDKFKIGPDRVKAAGENYFGHKSNLSKQIIMDQVQDLSLKLFKGSRVDLDEECNWVVFNDFKLPKSWADVNPGYETCKIMFIFPDQYPELPTNGFYLPDYIKQAPGDRHLFERGYGGAFGQNSDEMATLAGQGWHWYCSHIKPSAWQPAHIRQISDWHHGDSLWDIVMLASEVLSNPYED